MTRAECGTKAGMLAHRETAERPCGTCVYADEARRIAAEGIPSRPTPADLSRRPITPEAARINALILEAEVLAWEQEHRGFDRQTPLKVVRGGAA